MRILHIAPHYGGGIAPAVVGIFESINASHSLIEIEKTKDAASLGLLSSNKLLPININEIRNDSGFKFDNDLVIFHFWESSGWHKLAKFNFRFRTNGSVLLNHQSFSHNGYKVLQISHLFKSIVQSGYSGHQVPSEWTIIPTCNNRISPKSNKFQIVPRAIYLGTLAYKKIDRNFFKIASKLNSQGVSLDIYGHVSDTKFSEDLKTHISTSIVFQGYTSNSVQILTNYTYFFYPLRTDHYGTSENSLLEAMSQGLIPLVNDNPAERKILGKDLMKVLEIKKSIECKNSLLFHDKDLIRTISTLVESRAQKLTDVVPRKLAWKLVLDKSTFITTEINLSTLAQQMVSLINT